MIVPGYNSCRGTNMSGHRRVWAQTCLGTVMYGLNRVGTVMYDCVHHVMYGHVWAQMSGHKHVWAQSCMGTNMYGLIVWVQLCMGTNVVEPVLYCSYFKLTHLLCLSTDRLEMIYYY